MNWPVAEAVAQVVGAVAVVVSLIYLAAQIRQNTRLNIELDRMGAQAAAVLGELDGAVRLAPHTTVGMLLRCTRSYVPALAGALATQAFLP